MKVSRFLVFLLLWTSYSWAEEGLLLTRMEQLQDKVWTLQQGSVAQKTLVTEQQKRLEKLAAETAAERLEFGRQLAGLAQANDRRQEKLDQLKEELGRLKSGLDGLNEVLSALRGDLDQQKVALMEQGVRIDAADPSERFSALERALQGVRAELAAKQQDSAQQIASKEQDTARELAELREQLRVVREELDGVQQEVVGRIELILWGGGSALLLLAILLVLLGRRGGKGGTSSRRDRQLRHEL